MNLVIKTHSCDFYKPFKRIYGTNIIVVLLANFGALFKKKSFFIDFNPPKILQINVESIFLKFRHHHIGLKNMF